MRELTSYNYIIIGAMFLFVLLECVKINKTIGLSMSQETAKFLGSAIVTNIITSFGALLAAHAVAGVLAFIPVAGSALAAAGEAAIGYCLIYAAVDSLSVRFAVCFDNVLPDA